MTIPDHDSELRHLAGRLFRGEPAQDQTTEDEHALVAGLYGTRRRADLADPGENLAAAVFPAATEDPPDQPQPPAPTPDNHVPREGTTSPTLGYVDDGHAAARALFTGLPY